MVIRVFALSGKNRYISTMTLVLCMVLPICQIVSQAPKFGCCHEYIHNRARQVTMSRWQIIEEMAHPFNCMVYDEVTEASTM